MGTHTFATMEVSKPAYDEIRNLMQAGGYACNFVEEDSVVTLDMHGLGIIPSTGDFNAWADNLTSEEMAVEYHSLIDQANMLAERLRKKHDLYPQVEVESLYPTNEGDPDSSFDTHPYIHARVFKDV